MGRSIDYSLVNVYTCLLASKVLSSFTDINSMEIKKTRDSKKVIAEKRKQYLALQYEIYKYEKSGQPIPKEIIKQARKIRSSLELQ